LPNASQFFFRLGATLQQLLLTVSKPFLRELVRPRRAGRNICFCLDGDRFQRKESSTSEKPVLPRILPASSPMKSTIPSHHDSINVALQVLSSPSHTLFLFSSSSEIFELKE